ncbi:MAG: hypothetical protein ACOYJ1_14605 [Peptococcales bacterium]|jgi:biotin transporter BioY
MSRKPKQNKYEVLLKDIVLSVIVVVWIVAFTLDCVFKDYDIPWSVQTGLTMAAGFLLGEKALEALRKK